MKLFGLYLGGRVARCNIEVHDVIFCVAKSLEETYPIVVKKWFGDPSKVHIDSYIELRHVDGYRIELSYKTTENEKKLFFLHFGGYLRGLFGEMHQSAFFVAEDEREAIRKAKETLCFGLYEQHLDECINVENLLTISEIDGYHLIFTPDPLTPSSKADPGYQSVKSFSFIR